MRLVVADQQVGAAPAQQGLELAGLQRAVAEGEAVLIAVPQRYADAWNTFAQGLDVQLAPATSALDAWWRTIAREGASA